MKKILVYTLVALSVSLTASAGGQDAILGSNDSFGCDSFSRDAKVACMPNIFSNYRGRVSFPSGPAIILNAYQVIDCRAAGGDRDVICNANGGPGGPLVPGPSNPPPLEVRRVVAFPDLNCLSQLPQVTTADEMVSNGVVRGRRMVDRCELSRDLGQIRDMERRGFKCEISKSQTNNQTQPGCAENILSKVISQTTVKGSHRRILESEYCATKAYDCTRPF